MRLIGRFVADPEKHVTELTLRVSVESIPVGAEIGITDIQLQADRLVSGYSFAPEEVDTRPHGRHYVNGTITDSQPVMMMSNMLSPTGMRLEVLDAEWNTSVRLGNYRFGLVSGEAFADGETFESSQGWGRTPIITPRSDLQIDAEVSRKIHIRASWDDRRDGKDPRPEPPVEGPTVIGSHSSWGGVLSVHSSWADVLAAHTDWS